MKIKKVVNVLQTIDENRIPSDIKDLLKIEHWSVGLDKYIDIGDMDMYHLLRTFNILMLDRKKLKRILEVCNENFS